MTACSVVSIHTVRARALLGTEANGSVWGVRSPAGGLGRTNKAKTATVTKNNNTNKVDKMRS